MKFWIIVISILTINMTLYSQQISVAVIDLKNIGVTEECAVLLSDALRAEMFKYEKYKVMNRENMQEIMGEQAFQASGLCDDNQCYVEMGEVLGVQKIVTGSIGKLGNTYSLTVKMIDVETSENDKIIPYRKKCSEDDLFIMIENSVKILAGVEMEKIETPDGLKEIKEVEVRDNSLSRSSGNEISEWELLGITREEYKIELARKRYKEEVQSPIDNGVKSLVFPGWGNINRAWLYKTIELAGFTTAIVGLFKLGDDPDQGAAYVGYGFSIMTLNHMVSPVDAFITTIGYNSELKKKYNISMIPTYDRQNKAAGLGFVINF